jgi:hypothetical protein
MGIHAIHSFAPGVAAAGVEAQLDAALARAGRQVRARHAFPIAGDGPEWRQGALHWEVVEMFDHGGTVLCTYEVGGARWDLRFLRALSAVADGFVVGLDDFRGRERYGLGAMFAGRTIEIAEWEAGKDSTGIGRPPYYDALPGHVAGAKYENWFRQLCDLGWARQPERTRVLVAGEWELSPPLDGYAVDDEIATTRVLLALEEPRFRQALPELGAAGWRWRAMATPKIAEPMIELARESALDVAQVAAWGRALDCTFVAFEVAGGGQPVRTVGGRGDLVEVERSEPGFEPPLLAIGQFASVLGETAGMLFGRGDSDWNQV